MENLSNYIWVFHEPNAKVEKLWLFRITSQKCFSKMKRRYFEWKNKKCLKSSAFCRCKSFQIAVCCWSRFLSLNSCCSSVKSYVPSAHTAWMKICLFFPALHVCHCLDAEELNIEREKFGIIKMLRCMKYIIIMET